MTKVTLARSFTRAAKTLRKKYPHVSEDVQPLIRQLEKGETPGDRLKGLEHIVYKTRLPNRDSQRGKSSGYRVIYYLRTESGVLLLLIYSKSEMTDVPTEVILKTIEEAEREFNEQSPDEEDTHHTR